MSASCWAAFLLCHQRGTYGGGGEVGATVVLGLQEGPVKPEVAGSLVYKDGHTPRAHQVYANDKETNWRGAEGSETEPTPSGHCNRSHKDGLGLADARAMKGQGSLMLMCTELPLTYYVFGTALDCGCTQPVSGRLVPLAW